MLRVFLDQIRSPSYFQAFSSIRRFASTDKSYIFNEDDVNEEFARGWGPGGQKINKTANCVILKHNPTGIVVKCQETRDLHKNREIARKWLNERLDLHLNGSESEVAQLRREADAREKQRHLRAKRRLAAKLEFKIREGLIKNPKSTSSNTPDLEKPAE